MTTRMENVKRSSTVVVEETLIDSKPKPDVKRNVERKVHTPCPVRKQHLTSFQIAQLKNNFEITTVYTVCVTDINLSNKSKLCICPKTCDKN